MSELWNTTRTMDAEQLTISRNAELQRLTKLQFLLALLKKQNVAQEIDVSDKVGLQRALKTLTFQNYLRLGEENCTVLGLDNYKTLNITYTERKAVRNYIIDKLRETYQPIERFGRKIKEEFPEVFTTNSFEIKDNIQLIQLEENRRSLLTKLAELQSEKVFNLKAASELKTGHHQSNELELMLLESQLNQMNVDVLQKYFVNELISRTNYTERAIKEAALYVDAALEREE